MDAAESFLNDWLKTNPTPRSIDIMRRDVAIYHMRLDGKSFAEIGAAFGMDKTNARSRVLRVEKLLANKAAWFRTRNGVPEDAI